MAALWPLYISLHGHIIRRGGPIPRSGNTLWVRCWRARRASLSPRASSRCLPGVWVALGRAARIGYVLVLVALVIPGVVDLVIVAIVPPTALPRRGGRARPARGAPGGRLHPLTRIVFGVMAVLLAATMLQLSSPGSSSTRSRHTASMG